MDDNRKSRNDSETNLIMPNNGPTSPIKPRSGSISDVPRYEETLSFVAGDTGTQNMSAVDSDVYSWLLMNSDLFPSSNRNKNKDGNVDVNTSNVEVNDDTIVDDDILNVLKEESSEQKQKYNLNDSSIPLENGKLLSSLSAEENNKIEAANLNRTGSSEGTKKSKKKKKEKKKKKKKKEKMPTSEEKPSDTIVNTTASQFEVKHVDPNVVVDLKASSKDNMRNQPPQIDDDGVQPLSFTKEFKAPMVLTEPPPAPKVESKVASESITKANAISNNPQRQQQQQVQISTTKQLGNGVVANTVVWKINKASAGQYMKYFKQIAKGNQESCPAQTALQFFMKSKVGKEKLKNIYKICKQDPRIPVAPRTFCVLFHIIQMVRKGTEIPNSLPAELASVMTPSPTKGSNKKLTKSPNPNHVTQTAAAAGNQQQQPGPAEVVKNLQLQMQKRRGKFIFDAASQLWYNPSSKLFFNEKTKHYSKQPNGPFYMYNETSKKLQLIS